MIKKLTLLYAVFSFLGATVWAGNISGRLIDNSTKEAIEFAKVSVYNAVDRKLLKNAVSGKNGEFSFADVGQGKYLLKATYIGYSPIEIPLLLDAKRNSASLGNIEMTPTAHALKQVEVSGRKSQVRFEIDRKVFNVDQSLTSAGSSATELLRNIPSVEVAADGNILLRNNKNVIIWINGRPSGLNEDNRTQVLEQIPAETIDRVEIISNPSAKYSPEGSAGIINIVLKKVTKIGRYGSVSAGADTNAGRNATANIYFTSPKWELNANVGYRNDVRKMIFNSDRWTYNTILPDTTVRYSRDKVQIDGDGYFARAGITYHATEKDHITLTGMATTGRRNVAENIGNTRIKSGIETVDYRYSTSPNDRYMYTLSLDYTHEFSRKGHEIRAYMEQNWVNATSDMEINQMDALFITEYFQWKHSEATRNETNFQIDYSYPITSNSKLELGYKGEFLTRDNTVKAQFGYTRDVRSNQYQLDNIFGGSDNRNSVYINYAGKIKKLAYQLGLRGEYNVMKNNSVTYDKWGNDSTFNFDKNYPGLYPSLFLDYALPAGNQLQFNYTRRINRPKGRMTNPFVNVADSANIEIGNPDLTPEYSNAFELNHIKTWDKHMLSTVLYYRTTTDVIQTVNYVKTEGKYDIKYITMKNITNAQSAGFEFMAKNQLFKILDLTSTLNLFYSHLDGFEYAGKQYASTKILGWSGRIIANITCPAGITGQLSAGYASRRNIAQGETLPVWGMDAGLRKTFFDRKLLVNLTLRDLFNTRISKDITSGTNFYDYSTSQTNSRMLGIVVTYNFGNPVKKSDKAKSSEGNPLGGDY